MEFGSILLPVEHDGSVAGLVQQGLIACLLVSSQVSSHRPDSESFVVLQPVRLPGTTIKTMGRLTWFL